MTDHAFDLEAYWNTFGNGDMEKGRELLDAIAARLEHARECHKWGKKNDAYSPFSAMTSLQGEMQEWCRAAIWETPERQHDEALDIVAVAIRIAGKEYDS